MRGTSSKELEEAGEDTTGLVESKSKLRTKVQAYTGVDILTDTGAYKSTYEILLEISKVWEDMSDIDQAALLEMLAGKNRSNTLAAILSNRKDLEAAFESAQNAEGSALQENEKYLDSIQGRIDLFNNAVQTMWQNTLGSDIVKQIVDFGTKLIKIIDDVGLLKVAFIGLGTIMMKKYNLGNIFDSNTKSIDKMRKTLESLRRDEQKAIDNDVKLRTGRSAKRAEQATKRRADYEDRVKSFENSSGVTQSDTVGTSNKPNIDWQAVKSQIGSISQKVKETAQTAVSQIKDTTKTVAQKTKEIVQNARSNIKDGAQKVVLKAKDTKEQKKLDELKAKKESLWKSEKNATKKKPRQPKTSKTNDVELNEEQIAQQNYNDLLTKQDDLLAKQKLAQDQVNVARKEFYNLDANADSTTVEAYTNNLRNAEQELKNINAEVKVNQKELDVAKVKSGELGNSVDAVGKKGTKSFAKLGDALKGVGNKLKAVGKQLAGMAAQMLTMYAITTIMELAGKAVEAIKESINNNSESAEVAREKFEELSNELSNVTSELKSMESELDSVNSQIDAIQEKGTLSFSDKEDLENLKAQRVELERQISMQKTLQENLQKETNAQSIDAAKKYMEQTSFGSDKSKTERQEEAKETGETIGTATGLAIGAAIGSFIPGIGTLVGASIGALVGKFAGGAIGESTAGDKYDKEQSVGDAIANMKAQRTKLVKQQDEAFANGDTEAYKEATEALQEYDSMMATHISQIQESYNAIDWETASAEQREYKKELGDILDTYNIEMGGDNAKSNAISRIFGYEADYQLKKVHSILRETAQAGEEINLKDAFDTEEEYNAFIDRIKAIGISVTDIENYYADLVEIEKEAFEIDTWDAVKDISKLTTGVNALKDAFKELRDEGIISANTLISLQETFGHLGDEWTNFVNTVSSGSATMEEAGDAANSLATAYMENLISTGKYDSRAKYTYIAQLESIGVENAKDIVDNFNKKALIGDIANDVVNNTATIYSGTNKDGDTIAIAFKPVLPDGSILTDAELKDYAADVISGVRDDDLGIMVKTDVEFKGKDAVDQANDYFEKNPVHVFDSDNINENLIKQYEDAYGIQLDAKERELLLEKAITAEKAKQNVETVKANKGTYDTQKEQVENYQEYKENLDVLYQYNNREYARAFEQGYSAERAWVGNEDSMTKEFQNAYDRYADYVNRGNINSEEAQRLLKTLKKYGDRNYENAIRQGLSAEDAYINISMTEQFKRAYDAAFEAYQNGYSQYDSVKITVPITTEVDIENAEEAYEQAEEEFKKYLQDEGYEVKINLRVPTEEVDKIQSVFDTLSNAQKEYQENGYFSVDTMQSLLDDVGPEYLALLYDENGQLNLNKDTLYNIALARIEEMKLKAQNNILLEAERLAAEGSVEALNAQVTAMSGAAEGYDVLISKRLAFIRTALEERKALKPGEEGYLDAGFDVDGHIGGLQDQLNVIDNIANSTKANIQNSLSTSSNTAKSETEDLFQNTMDYWENRISANQAKYDQVQNEIDLLEKQGKRAGADYYEEQIKLEQERQLLLEQQKKAALKYLNSQQPGSEEWWRAADIINNLEGELDDVTSSIFDMSEAIKQIPWDNLTEATDRFSSLHDELSDIRDVLQADEMFDEEGNWTEAGVGILGTYVQDLEMYKNEVDKINNELANIDVEYSDNEEYYQSLGIDSEQELYDKREELAQQQRDYVKGAEDAAKAIADSYSEQVDAVEEYTNKLVESYNDYIDVVRESLDAERELYEFKKNINKQTKDIATLERRIASLSGSDNASDIAERRRLEAELLEQKEGLNDTYYDRAKDQQSQALDDESQAYEESMTRYIEHLRETLEQSTQGLITFTQDGAIVTNEFLNDITSVVMINADTVKDQYQKTGLVISDTLVTPWTNAAAEITKFGGPNGALAMMNAWTKNGGVFANFKTNATIQLTEPWSASTNALNSFKNNVSSGMNQIVSNVKSNVTNLISELGKIKSAYDGIYDSAVKAANAPSPNISNNNNNNTSKNTATATATVRANGKSFTQTATLNGSSDTNAAKQRALSLLQSQVISDLSNTSMSTDEAMRQWDKTWSKQVSYSNVKAYAKGTTGTKKDHWAITDEPQYGEELTLVPGKDGNLSFMRKGTGVVPADLTKRLFELAQMPLNTMGNNIIQNVVPSVTTNNTNAVQITFDSLVKTDYISKDILPEVEQMVAKQLDNFTRKLNYSIKKFQ